VRMLQSPGFKIGTSPHPIGHVVDGVAGNRIRHANTWLSSPQSVSHNREFVAAAQF
jgi:hypothetical protein